MTKARRLCLTTLTALLIVPMTGCIYNDLILSLFAIGGGIPGLQCNGDACLQARLQQAAFEFTGAVFFCDPSRPAECAARCRLRSKFLAAKDAECSYQQEQAQSAALPGGAQSQNQCKLDDPVVQEALADAAALSSTCP